MLVLNVLKQQQKRIDNFFFIILVASFIAVVMMAWLRGPSKIAIDQFILSEESIAKSACYLDQQNESLLNEALEYGEGEVLSSMQAISSQADKISELIQTAKKEMVLIMSDENQAAIQPDGRIDFREVIGKDARHPTEIVMIGPRGQGGRAFEL